MIDNIDTQKPVMQDVGSMQYSGKLQQEFFSKCELEKDDLDIYSRIVRMQFVTEETSEKSEESNNLTH